MKIRVYTLTEENTLQETAYDAKSGWYNGNLTSSKFQVAPYSRLAAVFLAGTDDLHLRIYAQKTDNTIQEYMWNGESGPKFHPSGCQSDLCDRRRMEGGHEPWSCSSWYWYRSDVFPLPRLQWPEHPVSTFHLYM
jgi:hypothetical protein